MNVLIQQLMFEQGWFDVGRQHLERIQAAGLPEEDLVWFVPRSVMVGIPGSLLDGMKLMGLPIVALTDRQAPPGLGWRLPVCTQDLDCLAHPQPHPADTHLLSQWNRRHTTEYLVVRPGRGLRPDYLGELNGRWYREGVFVQYVGSARVVRTDQFEVREDGARARRVEVVPDGE